MDNLVPYFNCGYIKEKNKSEKTWLDFIVTKFSDINEKIIPYFGEARLLGFTTRKRSLVFTLAFGLSWVARCA